MLAGTPATNLHLPKNRRFLEIILNCQINVEFATLTVRKLQGCKKEASVTQISCVLPTTIQAHLMLTSFDERQVALSGGLERHSSTSDDAGRLVLLIARMPKAEKWGRRVSFSRRHRQPWPIKTKSGGGVQLRFNMPLLLPSNTPQSMSRKCEPPPCSSDEALSLSSARALALLRCPHQRCTDVHRVQHAQCKGSVRFQECHHPDVRMELGQHRGRVRQIRRSQWIRLRSRWAPSTSRPVIISQPCTQ